MYYYKRTVKSGYLTEIEYIKSLKPRNKRNVARGKNICKTKEQQQKANKIRAIKNTQRLICCNFSAGDYFVRFSAPSATFAESEFRKEVNKFINRVKYHAKKSDLEVKYIGFIECGVRGKNWHLHIILSAEIVKIAREQWKWKNGINLQPLYEDGQFFKLAEYIRKDIQGSKRLMTSRNLTKSEVKVVKCGKRRFAKLEKGEIVDTPEKGYTLVSDYCPLDDSWACSYSFTFFNSSIFYERERKENYGTS